MNRTANPLSRLWHALALLLTCWCGLTQAQVPRTLNYQGYLTSASGAAISNASQPITINIYDALTAGNLLFTEPQTVTVSNGIFNLLIGSVTTLALAFDKPYWLGVAVGSDQEMTPRQPLASAPYSRHSALTDGLSATAVVPAAQISGNFGAITSSGPLNVSTSFAVESRPASTGGLNNFIGINAGAANTTGVGNTIVGHNSGKSNVSGSSNSFYGLNAGSSNQSGSLNVFIGQGAGAFNESGSNNNFVGQAAGFNAFNGSSNNFFGWHAGFATSTGNNNAFFGDQAGLSNNANNNAFFGSGAGMTNASGTQASYFGINAGNKTTASFNSFFGAGAGQFTTSGQGNTFFGNIAGTANTTGANNAFFGGNTGASNTIESRNTLLGDSADSAAGITNATAVGANAKVTASNSLVLGSVNGTNGATADTFVGIRSTAPNSTLQVNGSLAVAIRTILNLSLTSLTDTDHVLVITGSTPATVALPQPSVVGRVYIVKNRSSAPATLGFVSGGSTIDGASTLVIGANTGVAQLICDGTNWFKIN